jgi:hypothetical protein
MGALESEIQGGSSKSTATSSLPLRTSLRRTLASAVGSIRTLTGASLTKVGPLLPTLLQLWA